MFCLEFSCLELSCLDLSCLKLSCLELYCLELSCLDFSCPASVGFKLLLCFLSKWFYISYFSVESTLLSYSFFFSYTSLFSLVFYFLRILYLSSLSDYYKKFLENQSNENFVFNSTLEAWFATISRFSENFGFDLEASTTYCL